MTKLKQTSIIIVIFLFISSLLGSINNIFLIKDLKLEIVLNTFVAGSLFMVFGIFKNLFIIKNLHDSIIIQEQKEVAGEIEIDNTIGQRINGKSNILLFTTIILSIFGGLIINNILINLIICIITFITLIIINKQNNLITLNKVKNSKKDLKFIFNNYKSLIIFPGFLLSILFLVMEKTIIFYSGNILYIGLIILSIILGITLGNLISWRFYKFKWYKFMLFSLLYGGLMNIYPEYFKEIVFGFILSLSSGILFAINYNILETSFLRLTSDEQKENVGIITLGLISSFIFILNIIIMNKVEIFAGTDSVFQFLASIITLIGIIIYKIEGYLD